MSGTIGCFTATLTQIVARGNWRETEKPGRSIRRKPLIAADTPMFLPTAQQLLLPHVVEVTAGRRALRIVSEATVNPPP
jgi:hypothetical protein